MLSEQSKQQRWWHRNTKTPTTPEDDTSRKRLLWSVLYNRRLLIPEIRSILPFVVTLLEAISHLDQYSYPFFKMMSIIIWKYHPSVWTTTYFLWPILNLISIPLLFDMVLNTLKLITIPLKWYAAVSMTTSSTNSLSKSMKKIKIDLCIIMFNWRSENNTHSSAMDQTNKTYTSHFYYFYLLSESILWWTAKCRTENQGSR